MATLYQLKEGLVKANKQGNTEAVEKIGSAIRQHPTYQKQGEEALRQGFKALSGDERKEAIANNTAKALGIKRSELDAERGMGGWSRFKLGMLRDEESKIEQLEKTYGRENLRVVNVAGNDQILYKDNDETQGKWRRVDEQGFSLADIADVSGAIVPTVGAIGGAAAVAATGGTGLIPLALGAAAGGFGAGVTQDVATEVATGQDVDIGDITKQNMFESAVGIPIDVVTGFGGRAIMRTVGKRAVEDATTKLFGSLDELQTRFPDIDQPRLLAAQEAGDIPSMKQGARAAKDMRGPEAKAYGEQRDVIMEMSERLKGGQVAPQDIDSLMQRISTDQLDRLDRIKERIRANDEIRLEAQAKAKKQTAAQKEVEKRKLEKVREQEHEARVLAAEKELNKLRRGSERIVANTGQTVRKSLAKKFVQSEREADKLYKEAYDLLDTPNAYTPAGDVRRVLGRIDDSLLEPDSIEQRTLAALRKRVEAPDAADLSFRELDGFVKDIADRVNWKQKHGIGRSAANVRGIAKTFFKLRDDAIGAPKTLGGKGAGVEAKKALERAKTYWLDNVLAKTESDVGSVLRGRPSGAGYEMADEDVISRALSNSRATKEIINSSDDPIATRNMLRDRYVDDILDQAGPEREITVPSDLSVLRQLYTTKASMDAFLDRVKRVNNVIRSAKQGKQPIDQDALRSIMDSYSAPAAARAEKAAKLKAAREAQAKEITNSHLMKVAKGEELLQEDVRAVVENIVGLRPGQISKLKSKLSPGDVRTLEQKGIELFLERSGSASGRAQKSGFQTGRKTLWDPQAMSRQLNDQKLRSQWEELLGKDVVRDYENLNNWLISSEELVSTGQEALGRFVATSGNDGTPNILVVSASLPAWLGRKILGLVHTNPYARSVLRRRLQQPQELTQGQLLGSFFTMMGTTRGLDAITEEAAYDPRFRIWLNEAMAAQGDETISTAE